MTITKLLPIALLAGSLSPLGGQTCPKTCATACGFGSGHPQQDDIQQMFSAMRDEMLQVSIGI